MRVGQNRLKRKVPTRVKQGALPFSVSPNSITQSVRGGGRVRNLKLSGPGLVH